MVGPMFDDDIMTKARDETIDVFLEKLKYMIIELVEEGYLGR